MISCCSISSDRETDAQEIPRNADEIHKMHFRVSLLPPRLQRILDDAGLRIEMFPGGICGDAREEFHVKNPSAEERAAEESGQRRRDTQKFCAALGVVEWETEDQTRHCGEDPSGIMAHHAPLDGTAEEPHARTDDHARIAMIFRQTQETQQFFQGRREIGIPECHIGRMRLKSMKETLTHRFRLPVVVRKNEKSKTVGLFVAESLQYVTRSIRAAVVDEEKTNARKTLGERHKGIRLQSFLFVETRNHHRYSG